MRLFIMAGEDRKRKILKLYLEEGSTGNKTTFTPNPEYAANLDEQEAKKLQEKYEDLNGIFFEIENT